MEKNIIIIGMGPAAVGAASSIQHTDTKAKITLIEKKDYESYSPCALPFAFEDKLGFDEIIHKFPSKGLKSKIYIGTEAKNIDVIKKQVMIQNNAGETELSYDSLIIATGTKPVIPRIKNLDAFFNPFVMTVNTLEEVSNLYSAINLLTEITGYEVTIAGAGAIGLEFSIAMKNKGLETTVVEMENQVMPNAIDEDMAEHVQSCIENKGVKVITNSKIEELTGKEKIESVKTEKEEIKTSFLVLAAGTKPNLDLPRRTALHYNQNGLVVNRRMKTNMKDIYAAGDCVQTYNAVTKKKCRSALAIPAINQGKIAGINSAGGICNYKGTFNTFISILDEYAIGGTGITADQAKKEGYKVTARKITGRDKPEWYPGNKELIVKLVADKGGKLLGGQAFGEKNAVKNKIDIIASYLQRKSNLKDMKDSEVAYCPDVTGIPDPLTVVIDVMARRIK